MPLTGFGLTASGFVIPSLDDVNKAIVADLQATFGAGIDVGSKSNFGQLAGVVSELVADAYAQALAVWNAFTTDGATGVNLDFVESLRGILRLVPLPSTVTITCTGTAGTVLAVSPGQLVQVPAIGTQFTSAITDARGNPIGSPSTIAAAAAWAPSTTYSAGDRRKNSGNVYQCAVGGLSAGSGGPTGNPGFNVPITDNLAQWIFLGVGAGVVDVPFQSSQNGAIFAPAGQLTSIQTPVAGWSSAVNLADAALGRLVETDSAYRSRAETIVHEGGAGYIEAIRSAILALSNSTPPVTACTVYENTTDFTDAQGRPPHSVECLVTGGAPADVAKAIFLSKPAGIATYGAGTVETVTVTDSQGHTHTILYSVPTDVPIYVAITVYYNPEDPAWSQGTAGGIAAVKEAIVEYGDGIPAGSAVRAAVLGAQAFTVSGVDDTPVVDIGLTPSPVSNATLIMGVRQQATFSTLNVAVTAAVDPDL